jgi:divalent metal cation (Fe/Co/Zn/Cd) transporter
MSSPATGEARTLRLTVAAYVAVLAITLFAYFLTGVLAFLAAALHTLGDIFVSGFLPLAVM